MTISISLKSATGALFLNDSGDSNDGAGAALHGFVDFVQGDRGAVGRIRLEGTARLCPMSGPRLRYVLAFGRGLSGSMFLEVNKRSVGDPDYTGFVGSFDELVVSGWNRRLNGRCYVLLNLRENPAAAAVRLLSSI